MKLKEKAKKLKKDIPAVYLSLKDKRTPFIAKFLAVLTVGYALSPIDLIPDFIPVLGYLDDLIILPSLVALTIKLIPKDLFLEYQKNAEHLWDDGKPKKWIYALPIFLIYLLIVYLLIKAFFL